ncbi:MAG TPA: CoA-transferase [Candidatus Limnocylindria bacterium]|jgi:glutaconate CoA-transferase subunit A|nr:CoA-transferase [Candidatus Limnocylindria bacterium]
MSSKVVTLREAVAAHVHDGDILAIEGFTHLISFAAAHEVIRQGRRGLTLARLTPDLVYDQMVGAGCAARLIFSWLGNPGVGSLHAIRRAIEAERLEIEEYSHHGMVARYAAGASRLPFFPLRSYDGSDLPAANPLIRRVASPYDGEEIAVVPPLNPDVTIIHAQRADADGNVQAWGIVGVQREAALAARHVIAVVEELVDATVIRDDPDRTLLPGTVVDAVCVEPFGAHPSFAQGHYDRDNAFYRDWDAISREPARLDAWLDEWVLGLDGRAAYAALLGPEALAALRPQPRPSGSVDYGSYR